MVHGCFGDFRPLSPWFSPSKCRFWCYDATISSFNTIIWCTHTGVRNAWPILSMKHLTTTFYYVGGRESAFYSGKSSQQRRGIHSRRRHAPPDIIALWFLGWYCVYLCLVKRNGIISRKSGFATSKAAFYSGKSSQQRRGVQSRRRHGPPTHGSLWKIG